MTTFQRTSMLSEVFSERPIPKRMLTFFRARLSNRIHSLVLAEFARQEEIKQINRAELGRKIGRKPEQITRWLGSPGNWTLDTVSDLLLGMGLEPTLGVAELANSESAQSEVTETIQLAANEDSLPWNLQTNTANALANKSVITRAFQLYADPQKNAQLTKIEAVKALV